MNILFRKRVNKWATVLVILFLFLLFLNFKYKIIAFNVRSISDNCDLRVLTWNIHCPKGADGVRQKAIAELILKENADFVLLNEYWQDSCKVIDSLLKLKYPYTEEFQSHNRCGDIFYSKKEMKNSGHVYIPIFGKGIPTIKATISIDKDSIQIFGIHMTSNSGDGSAIIDGLDSLKKTKSFYDRYKIAQRSRNFQAHWTKENVTIARHPVIVMGDMNDFNSSAPLDTFSVCGLVDSWWEGGFGYGCTFHTGWMRLRIDHVLHDSSLTLTNIKVVDTDLSDHNPIVAEFRITK